MKVTTQVTICLHVKKMVSTATMAEYKQETTYSAAIILTVTSTIGLAVKPSQSRVDTQSMELLQLNPTSLTSRGLTCYNDNTQSNEQQNTKVKVVTIFTWHLTPWAQAHYEAGEVVVVEYSTDIEATTNTLDAIAILTISNIYQLKTILYLHLLQSAQLQIVVEVMLKGPTS